MIKKQLALLAGLILIGTTAFAQDANPAENTKWAIGLSFSPDYNYLLPYNKAYKVSTPYYKESNMMSLSFGVNALYKLSNRFGLELSVCYAAKGKRATNIYSGLIYDPSIPGANYQQHVTYKYQFLEIPLKLNAYLLNKRFKIFPSLGVAANVFLGKQTRVSDNYSETSTVSHSYVKANISSVYISAIASIGLSYDVSKRFFVKLEPNYRQFVTSIVDGGVRGYFYSVGCNTGMYYRF